MASRDVSFQVQLKGLPLSSDMVGRIENRVREAVLVELASMKFKGGLAIGDLRRINPKWIGIWVEEAALRNKAQFEAKSRREF